MGARQKALLAHSWSGGNVKDETALGPIRSIEDLITSDRKNRVKQRQ